MSDAKEDKDEPDDVIVHFTIVKLDSHAEDEQWRAHRKRIPDTAQRERGR